MTVVEMLVATMILAVGVLGVMASLRGGTASAAVGEHRLVASRLATSELEVIRSLALDDVGIDPASVGYVPWFEGRATVSETVNLVEPVGSETKDGVEYTIERHVTWAEVDAASGHLSEAYKQVTVLIGWTDEGGDHEIRQDTGLVESALEAQ